MRNGTTSNLNKLIMVSSNGRPMPGSASVDDAAVDYPFNSDADVPLVVNDARGTRATMLVFMAVSIACTTAAVATGSYAIWLSRHQAARQALIDVDDILKSCQSRMQQLEADVQRLPERQSPGRQA